MLGVWEEYFKKLLNPKGEYEMEISHSVRRELEVRTITEEQVEKAVKKMKNGKAVGVDELSVEMVKANELVGIKWLTRLFNVCCTTGEIPAEWRRGVSVLIWKGKGDIHDQERHYITAPSPEIYGKDTICEGEAYSGEQNRRESAGIRKGRGTYDGLFAIRPITEKRSEFRKDVAFGFVDLEKAFDTVPRDQENLHLQS